MPWLIRNLQGTSAVGKDLNKRDRPLVAEMGGLGVIVGFYTGVTILAVIATQATAQPYFFASLAASLGAGFVGLLDDILGLRKRTKALLPFLLATPLGAVVVASGNTTILGVNIGVLMLIAVALGVTSAANAANMLEGFNGLGAGLMIIITVALILLSLLHGASTGLFILFPLLGALAAFLAFNRYPARVFPGDSMTLFAGAAVACAAIISVPSLKALGALLFAPMIAEFLLKARGRFRAENYGSLTPEDLLSYRGRIESLAHLIMRRQPRTEREIVAILWIVQAIVAATVLLGSWLFPGG